MRFIAAIWLLLVFLLPGIVHGQQENLILNGSLEEFHQCPFNIDAQIGLAKHWSAGVPGGISSTDYYHACAGVVPNNGGFTQVPQKGNAYFGTGYSINPYDSINAGIREFASGQLSRCLTAGKKYRLSFAVCMPFFYAYAMKAFDCFEVFFHQNEFAFGAENWGIITRFPEVADQVLVMPVEGPIAKTGHWHQLETTFTATGNECNFTVGCFKKLLPHHVGEPDTIRPGVMVQMGVHYMYDDFVLVEIPDDTLPEQLPEIEPVLPNVFTPNGDGINDFWVIDHLPAGTAVAIYNRWGQQVYYQQNYQNNWGGEGLPAGSYIAEVVFRDLPPRRVAVYIVK